MSIRPHPEMQKPIDGARSCAQHKILFEHTPHFLKWLGDCEIPPELRNPPRITKSGQTDRNKSRFRSTIHSSAQKTGSSELWRIHITPRIVCCLAKARQQLPNAFSQNGYLPFCAFLGYIFWIFIVFIPILKQLFTSSVGFYSPIQLYFN